MFGNARDNFTSPPTKSMPTNGVGAESGPSSGEDEPKHCRQGVGKGGERRAAFEPSSDRRRDEVDEVKIRWGEN